MEKMFDAKEKLKQEKNFQGNIGFEDIMEQHEKMGVIVNTSPYRPGNFAASRPDYGFALYMLIYFHDRQVVEKSLDEELSHASNIESFATDIGYDEKAINNLIGDLKDLSFLGVS